MSFDNLTANIPAMKRNARTLSNLSEVIDEIVITIKAGEGKDIDGNGVHAVQSLLNAAAKYHESVKRLGLAAVVAATENRRRIQDN